MNISDISILSLRELDALGIFQKHSSFSCKDDMTDPISVQSASFYHWPSCSLSPHILHIVCPNISRAWPQRLGHCGTECHQKELVAPMWWLIQPHWVMDLSLSQWSAWLAKLDHLDWVTRRASVQLCVWESKIFKICADLRKLGGKNLVNNNLFRIKEGEFLYFPPLYCSELLTAVFYIELKKERF